MKAHAGVQAWLTMLAPPVVTLISCLTILGSDIPNCELRKSFACLNQQSQVCLCSKEKLLLQPTVKEMTTTNQHVSQ